MDVLSELLDALRLRARIDLHATFCDRWQVDTGEDPVASFHVVSKGECWLHVPDRPPISLHPHDLVFVPRNARHVISHSAAPPSPSTPKNRPAEHATGPSTTLICGHVEFEQDDWNPLVDALPPYIVLPVEEYGRTTLGNMCKTLVVEAETAMTGSRVVMDRLADVLFVEIVRLHVSRHDSSSFLAAIVDTRLGAALTEFHANVAGSWSTESLARVSGMSRSAFAARFQELTGMAPMYYVRRWRMQQGRRLLVSTSDPIVKIAESCGYGNEESFAKAIKREFGLGPKAIRGHRSVSGSRPMVTVDSESQALAKVLFSPLETQQLVGSGKVCVVDVRTPAEYASDHIPGAINVYESYNVLSETTPEGLEEMAAVLGETFAAAGIDANRQVIVYEDDLISQFGASCRCYFQLSLLGHPNVGILDGGLDRWRAEGLPLSRTQPPTARGNFTARVQPAMLATVEDMIAAIGDPGIKILDNRDVDEWTGAASAPDESYGVDFTPRKGRIPGACWIEWKQFLETRDGVTRFRSDDQIVALCAQAGLYVDDEIIVYCFKGSRSSNTLIALKTAGFKHVRNYYGSWNEWSRDPALPVMSSRFPG